MALTKSQAAMLSNDLLLRGVIETIVNESAILSVLPFMDVTGTSVRYTRESALPNVNFYDVGDTWTESTPEFTSHTAELTILGGDADVDHFLQSTYSDTNDLEAEVISAKAKAIAHAFSDAFINGSSIIDPNSFTGLNQLITGDRVLESGPDGDALSLARLDELVDMIRPGRPDVLMMSKRTRRQLKHLRRTSGVVLETSVNQFGQQVETYEGIPIVVDDFIEDTDTVGENDNTGSIYALKLGVGAGVAGLEHGGITIERVGELETKDATRTRLKWYCGLALFSELGAARLTGITA